jgi:hypothetical protein
MDGNEGTIDDIRRYCDAYSILAFYGNKLIRIRCPFRVRLRLDYAGWKGGEVFIVAKIMVTRDLQMIYIIRGNGYHFYLFQILLP